MLKNKLQESVTAINGVPGRMFGRVASPDGKRYVNQRWLSESRPVEGYGTNGQMCVELRFDDECKNGHQTFAITAEVRTVESRRQRDIAAGGCMHDEIATVFPELAPLIKWHLVSTDGPMHGIANAVYHASNRDHHGLLKGESRQIRNGKSGQLAWQLQVMDNNGNPIEKPAAYIDSDVQPPCNAHLVYVPWCRIGEGKERDFAAARNCAVWPEATDEQLSLPKEELTALLVARMPALLADFRAAMLGAGFEWEYEA